MKAGIFKMLDKESLFHYLLFRVSIVLTWVPWEFLIVNLFLAVHSAQYYKAKKSATEYIAHLYVLCLFGILISILYYSSEHNGIKKNIEAFPQRFFKG